MSLMYDPDRVSEWSRKVIDLMSGEGESIKNCSKSFNEQIEQLVTRGVWSGPAALKNYNDFMETHNSLVRFINTFGQGFEEAMKSANTAMSLLEQMNAGGTSNDISSSFGSLSFESLSSMMEKNINTGVIKYNHNAITSISSSLNGIYNRLDTISNSLKNKIGELNSNGNIWEGNSAENAKTSLLSILTKNMTPVMTNLNTCIKNIQTAADNASRAGGSTFAYNPEEAKKWANSVVSTMDAETDSIRYNASKFNEQLSNLVRPNVWTGPAASKNYADFIETHNALVTFVNNFGTSFSEAITDVNKCVSDLEKNNAANIDNNIAANFGTLTFDQITNMAGENINTSVVTYDYATISSIATELNRIYTGLEGINTNLKTNINVLNNGNNVWDGDKANNAKDSLTTTLNNNMPKVMESLKKCIDNINEAAELARMADNA